MALLLGDLPWVEQVELDSPHDIGDAALAVIMMAQLYLACGRDLTRARRRAAAPWALQASRRTGRLPSRPRMTWRGELIDAGRPGTVAEPPHRRARQPDQPRAPLDDDDLGQGSGVLLTMWWRLPCQTLMTSQRCPAGRSAAS